MCNGYTYVRETLPWEGSLESQKRSIANAFDELGDEYDQVELVDTASYRTVPLRDRPQGKLLFEKPERGDLVITAESRFLFGSGEDYYHSLSCWRLMEVELLLIDDRVFVGDDRPLDVLRSYKQLDETRRSEAARISLALCREQGRPLNQHVALGFRRKKIDGVTALVVDHEERRTMAEIVGLREAGETWEAIYWKFYKEGRKNKHGKEWSMTRIRRAHDAELALRKEQGKKRPRLALTESG